MRQFDVYTNPSERSREIIPFVLVLQSHLLSDLPTVVVAPMLLAEGRQTYTQISAVIRFQERNYVVSVAELAAIEVRVLGKVVGNLTDSEDLVRRALDRLFTGF